MLKDINTKHNKLGITKKVAEIDTTVKQILIFFFICTLFVIFNLFSSIILPLVMAMITAILTHPFVRLLSKWKFPKWLITPIIMLITLAVFFVIYKLFETAFENVASQWDDMADKFLIKLDIIVKWINETLALEVPPIDEKVFREIWSMTLFSDRFNNVATYISETAGFLTFYILYFLLFISGINDIGKYLNFVEGSEAGSKLLAYYEVMQGSISSYIIIKTIISLCTSLLILSICYFYDIDFLIFIAILTFILNFIPNIGSIIASLIPILIGFIQFEYLQNLLLFSILIVSVQVVMGNVIEPIIMGNKNRINTATILFGLVFWGIIWGIPGMILSVPLLVMMKMLFEQFETTATFARIMSSPD